MPYYAQIKDNVVVAVTQTHSPIESQDMIEIDELMEIGGWSYVNGSFQAPPEAVENDHSL